MKRARRRILSWAVMAAAVSMAFAGCTSGASPSAAGAGAGVGTGGGNRANTAGLTLAKADQILASVMATNNKANAALDTKLLAGYESGSAFSIDAASYKADRLAHIGGSSNVPFDVKALQTVLGSDGGRESFLVVGETHLLAKLPKSQLGACPDADTLLLFQRTRSGRWQIVLEPSADTGPFYPLEATKSGVLSPVSGGLSQAASGIPARVANALVHYEASGQLGGLSKSDFGGSCWTVPNPRTAVETAQAQGFDARQLYSPTGETFVSALRGGRALVLFTLSTTETIVAPSGSAIRWRHDSAAPWTALLAGGLYSRVTENGDVQLACVLNQNGSYSIVGAYSGWTSVTGTKTKAPSSGGPPTLL